VGEAAVAAAVAVADEAAVAAGAVAAAAAVADEAAVAAVVVVVAPAEAVAGEVAEAAAAAAAAASVPSDEPCRREFQCPNQSPSRHHLRTALASSVEEHSLSSSSLLVGKFLITAANLRIGGTLKPMLNSESIRLSRNTLTSSKKSL